MTICDMLPNRLMYALLKEQACMKGDTKRVNLTFSESFHGKMKYCTSMELETMSSFCLTNRNNNYAHFTQWARTEY